MMKIESEDGRVLVQATDGSHISNITIGRKRLVGGTVQRQHVLQGIFFLVVAMCCGIFALMILGVKI